VVVTLIAAMAILPTLESLARRLFDASIPGAVLYAQHLTLWVGFLGALLASTGMGKHLALARVERLLTGRAKAVARWYVATLSAGVAALLAYASLQLVIADTAQNSELPGGIPAWWSEVVMPITLALMAVRFAWSASDGWRGRTLAAIVAAGMGALGLLEAHASLLVIPGTLALLVGLGLGTPVFVAMAGIAMLLFFAEGTPVAAVPSETFRLVASATLPAIPLLTVTGYVLAAGGASKRLLRVARAFVGFVPGGIAIIVCVVCAGFTTFTGGSGVTILALGGLVLPMLVAEKYPEGFSLGLVTSAGSLGLLFPPSLPVILYAVVAQANIEDLYIAGFAPGLLLVLIVAVFGVIVGVRSRAPRHSFDLREAGQALWQAKWELAIPVVVVFAIFTGFATIVEASALALVLAVLSQTVAFRDLHPTKALPAVVADGATLVGAVLILLGVAMGLMSYLVDAELPARILAWTQTHIESRIVFLLALNVVLLVLGSVLEIYSSIVVLSPLLAPMAVAYGIDPTHLGIIFLANLELSFLFPPMGLNLILASTRFNEPLARLYRVTWPFLLIRAVGLLLITYAPFLTVGVLEWVRR
jgi:tripartite ATP-independent transporter DctM subunit